VPSEWEFLTHVAPDQISDLLAARIVGSICRTRRQARYGECCATVGFHRGDRDATHDLNGQG